MRPPELERLARMGRTRLANLPTPLLPAPALSERLGRGVRAAVKADAWTGLGLGGNKVRGNPRLHRLLGARVVTIAADADRAAGMAGEARRIESGGGRALVIPVGASTARGALGYVRSLVEIHDQHHAAAGAGAEPPWIFVSSSSGGTLAGLVVGCAILGWRARLVGVSPDDPAPTIRRTAVDLAQAAAALLAGANDTDRAARPGSLRDRVDEAALTVHTTDAFVGPGYGLATPACEEAIAMFGALAGVVLDPVYTGKAAAAMIAWIREGRIPRGAHAILLHTGGHPALFK